VWTNNSFQHRECSFPAAGQLDDCFQGWRMLSSMHADRKLCRPAAGCAGISICSVSRMGLFTGACSRFWLLLACLQSHSLVCIRLQAWHAWRATREQLEGLSVAVRLDRLSLAPTKGVPGRAMTMLMACIRSLSQHADGLLDYSLLCTSATTLGPGPCQHLHTQLARTNTPLPAHTVQGTPSDQVCADQARPAQVCADQPRPAQTILTAEPALVASQDRGPCCHMYLMQYTQ
jgi:hypothetical protein